MLARVYLAQRQYEKARAALEQFCAFLDRPGDTYTTIEFLALHAVALFRDDQRAQAHIVMARLLALTEGEDYIRVYLDAGEPMQRLLRNLLDAPHDQDGGLSPAAVAYVTKLLAAFGQEAQRATRHVQNHYTSALSSSLKRSDALIEPLTQREHEVLHLLAAGASNQEIAAQLVISLATVKKHVSNLLGKLHPDSRTQAVARARELSHCGHLHCRSHNSKRGCTDHARQLACAGRIHRYPRLPVSRYAHQPESGSQSSLVPGTASAAMDGRPQLDQPPDVGRDPGGHAAAE